MNGYLKSVKSVASVILDYSRLYMLVNIIFTFLLNILSLSRIYILQQLMNKIQLGTHDFSYLVVFSVIYVLADILERITDACFMNYESSNRLKFKLYINKKILEHAESLPLSAFENSKTFDIIERTKNFVPDDIFEFFQNHVRILSSVISSIFYVNILLTLDIFIFPLIFLIPLFQFYVNNKINKRQYNILRNRTNKNRESWYYKFLLLSGSFYKELKIYNFFTKLKKKFLDLEESFQNQDISIIKESSQKNGFLSVINSMILGYIFIDSIARGYSGKLLLGDIVSIVRAITSLQLQVTSILTQSSDSIKKRLFFDQFLEFFELDSYNWGGSDNISINTIDCIEVVDLSFKYINQSENILKNISFKLEKGNFYAIKGENGCGKTTLIKLLLGLYDNYEGEILINGINLKLINREEYLFNTAVLFQDFLKFEGKLSDNIKLNSRSDTSVEYCIKKFGLNKLVQSDFDCQLGYWFEDGKQLSSGEWQKVALARCFYRNSSFVILDEPNSNLDIPSVAIVSDIIKKQIPNVITLSILHNIGTFESNIDYFLNINNGLLEVVKNERKT